MARLHRTMKIVSTTIRAILTIVIGPYKAAMHLVSIWLGGYTVITFSRSTVSAIAGMRTEEHAKAIESPTGTGWASIDLVYVMVKRAFQIELTTTTYLHIHNDPSFG